MTEERKAIVTYLRDVAKLYLDQTEHVLEVCADDIEKMHPDTLPTNLDYASKDLTAEIRHVAHSLWESMPVMLEEDMLPFVMRLSRGRANPQLVNQIIDEVVGG